MVKLCLGRRRRGDGFAVPLAKHDDDDDEAPVMSNILKDCLKGVGDTPTDTVGDPPTVHRGGFAYRYRGWFAHGYRGSYAHRYRG